MMAVIVGAGVAGLAAAHRLARAGAEVIVLEASERIGGMVAPLEGPSCRSVAEPAGRGEAGRRARPPPP